MQHKKLSERILSLALTAAMVLTVMPATVFTAEGEPPAVTSGSYIENVEQPAESAPSAEQPTESAPSAEQPAESAPPVEQPAESAPPVEQPAESAPPVEQPAESAPPVEQPAESAPPAEQPAKSAPPAEQPAADKPATEKSAYDKAVELFTALPNVSVVKSGLTADTRDELIAQVASALEAYEALSEEDRARFETEQHDLLVSAVALSGELSGVLPMVMLEGGDTLTLGALDPNTKTFKDAIGTGTGKYQSIIVGFTLSQADPSEAIILPTDVAGYTYQSSISSSYANIITVDDESGKTAVEIAQEYIRKIKFNGGSAGQSISITLNFERLSYRTFSWGGNGHFYQYVPFTTPRNPDNTWLVSYDKAKAMKYNGRTGYLATVTSKEEDLFIREASGSIGWLGGARMALKEGIGVDDLKGAGTASLLFEPISGDAYAGDSWYWACGPEADDTFYDAAAITSSDYRSVHTRNQGKGYYFNWEIKNGQEPNSGTNEAALATLLLDGGFGYQTGDGYAWNDLNPSSEGNGGKWDSKGFFVEYGDQINGDSGSDSESGSIGGSTDIEAPFPEWLTNAGLTSDAVAYSGRPVTVKLNQEVTLTSPIVLPANSKVTIDLNGSALTSAAGQPAIKVASGGVVELSLTDTSTGSAPPALVGGAGQPAIDFSGAGAGSKVTMSGSTSVKGGNGDASGAAGGDGIKGNSNTTIVVDANCAATGGSGGVGGNGGNGVTGGTVTINGNTNGGTGGANTTGVGGNGGIGASGTLINGSGAATGGDGGGGSTINGSGGNGTSTPPDAGSTLTVINGKVGALKESVTITGLTAPNPAKVYDGTAIENSAFGSPSFNPAWTGTLTYTYYKGSVLPANKLTSAPKDAGSYVVVAAIPDTDINQSGSVQISFTIEKQTYSGVQAAQPDGTTASKTDTTITLPEQTVDGETVEYGYSTTNSAPTTWQDDTAFAGLSANTDYYFFARVKENDNHCAGATSAGTAIKTEKSTYASTEAKAPDASKASKTDTTITLEAQTVDGETVEYGYSTTGSAPTTWQDSREFKDLDPSTDYYFFARVKENDKHYAGTTSAGTAIKTAKSAYIGTETTAPDETTASKTDTTITLPAQTVNGETVEYGYSTTDSAPTTWQDSREFKDLDPNTDYYFFARVKENDKHCAGATSAGTAIKTEKSTYTSTEAKAPDASKAIKTDTTITLEAQTVDGETVEYGYSTTDSAPTTWQDSREFKDLDPSTDYYFFARVKENDKHYAGETSAGTAIKTAKSAYTGTETTAPDETTASKTDTTITLPAQTVEGETVEYGYSTTNSAPTTWQDSREFNDLDPNTDYYFFARVKENDKHYAGATSAGTAIKTEKSTYASTEAKAPDASKAIKTDTTITLEAQTVDGETVEYGYSTTDSAPTTWQDSREFKDLDPSTDYYFFARVKENDKHYAGATSAGTAIKTAKSAYTGTETTAPDGTTASKTDTTITLPAQTVDGETVEYGYSTTGSAPTTWQDSREFKDLDPNTDYYFFARVKENDKHYAGATSAGTAIKTAKSAYTGTETTAPDASKAIKTDTTITLEAQTVDGETVEYGYSNSATGTITWQDSTTFSPLSADTDYFFFARIKENATHKAGATSDSTAIKTDLSDKQKVDAAKKVVDDAFSKFIATNATNADAVMALVNKALSDAGITDITPSWDISGAFSKNAATEDAVGGVTGKIKLTCGVESAISTLNRPIAQLPSDPAARIAVVKAAIEAAINAYKPTNTTTAADIKAIVDKVNADSSVIGVKVAWKIPSDFNKTESTNSSDGKITGTFELSCTTISGSATDTVSVNRPIERTDEQKLADAKVRAEAALAAMKATNATTDAHVLAAVNKALSDAGLTGVTAAWKTAPDGFDKVLATEDAAGSIAGKIELSLNSKKIDVNTNLPIARLVADKTALKNAITAATKEKINVNINNNSVDKVESGKRFVTTAEMNAFDDAIANAQNMANNTYATATEVTNAIQNLADAVKAFKDAVKTGTQTGGSGSKPVGSITISTATTVTAGKDLTLTGIVTPANATNRNIVWSVKSAGATGATIVGNTLKTTGAGTVVVTATIKNGIAAGVDYTQDVTITVLAANATVSGTVNDENGRAVSDATVKLMQGETEKNTTTTDGSGNYSFAAVPNGIYKIVVTTNTTPSVIVTDTIVVEGGAVTKRITILGDNKNIVVVSTPGTPQIAVGGMNDLLDASNISETLTSIEKAAVDASGSVELKFVADKRAEAEVAEDKGKIEAMATGKKIDTFLDLSMLKTVKNNVGTVITRDEKISTLASIIEVQLPIPTNLQDKTGLSLYRIHNGIAEALQKDLSDANGEYYTISNDGTFMTLFVKNFSTYALGYTTFTVTINDGGTGASGSASYNPGENVTIIAGNKSGYTFNSWTVAAGTIGLADASNATTTFTMPNENVTVTASWSTNSGGSNGGSNGGSGSGNGNDSSYTYYYIKATAGPGGSISTPERVKVGAGESAGFTITPNKGYQIENVLVNGKSIGAKNYYAFTNVHSDQTIHATFKKASHNNPQTGVPSDNVAADSGLSSIKGNNTFIPQQPLLMPRLQ